MFTDTHCHLFSEYFDNIDKVLDEAKANEVNKYINNATNLDDALEVIKLSKNHNNLY